MDSAGQLLVVEYVDNREVSRKVVGIPQANIQTRVRFISDLGIDHLICGAISRQFEQILSASGVRTSPWLGGNVDDLIAAHSRGTLQNDSFFLPGCRRRRCRGARGRRRAGRSGLGQRKLLKEE